MRNVLLVIVTVVFSISNLQNVQAADRNLDREVVSSMHEQLTELIDFPEYGKNSKMETVIHVVFTVSGEGSIIVTKVKGEDEKLNDYIVNQLMGQKIEVTKSLEGIYFELPIRLDLL